MKTKEELKNRQPNLDAKRDFECSGIGHMGIPEGYANVSLSSYVTHTSSQSAAKQAIEKLISKLGNQILILSGPGPRYVGKTHLLCAGLLAAQKGRYINMWDVEIRICSSRSAGERKTEYEILNELIKEPLLAIDDVNYGSMGTRLEPDWLASLLLGREARLRPTILATNRHLISTCPEKGCALCLEDLLGNPIISGVTETIIIDGPNYRKVNLETKGGT